jgi:glycosyltransferase involved in cell wall biosynthesis
MPQVVLEAMACGLPVVATNISGTRDALGDAGILIPVRDPIALADALEYLADNPEGWLQYREKGLQRVSSFTWDTVAKQIQRIYHGMVKSPITPS